jgi:hypothetical protein
MISSLISLILLPSAASAPPPSWVKELLSSNAAKAMMVGANHYEQTRTSERMPLGGTLAPTKRSSDENPIVIPRSWLVDELARAAEVQKAMSRSIQDLKFTDARDAVIAFRMSVPIRKEALPEELIICNLLVGRYNEAYEESIRFLEGEASDWEDQTQPYLYLSLAAASRSEVYLGQAGFCYQTILAHHFSGNLAKLEELAQSPNDPKTVAVLSCLALGFVSREWFLEKALQIDPKCELAADELIYRYSSWRLYSKVRRVASSMVVQLPNGPARDRYLKAYADAEGKKDDPYVPKTDTINP